MSPYLASLWLPGKVGNFHLYRCITRQKSNQLVPNLLVFGFEVTKSLGRVSVVFQDYPIEVVSQRIGHPFKKIVEQIVTTFKRSGRGIAYKVVRRVSQMIDVNLPCINYRPVQLRTLFRNTSAFWIKSQIDHVQSLNVISGKTSRPSRHKHEKQAFSTLIVRLSPLQPLLHLNSGNRSEKSAKDRRDNCEPFTQSHGRFDDFSRHSSPNQLEFSGIVS